MRKIRDILRLRLAGGLSIRQINASTKVSVGAVQKLLSRAIELELGWPLPDDLNDVQLAQLFYPEADTRVSSRFQVPDWPAIHQELKFKGMTKQLRWEEYTQQYPNRCLSYSQFCDRYRHWRRLQKRSMRQLHKAGEKCFVDYCGQTVPIINADTGEIREAEIFVGVLGASNKTYAEVAVQIVERWILARLRHHSFFSLAELNQCIAMLLEELNQKPFKQLPGNRQQAFESLDNPALKPLPRYPYRYVDIKPVKVNIDYHVEYRQHHYSVPHQYVGEKLELHAGESLVTIYFRRQTVASHVRKHGPGMSTEASHMPTRHRKHMQWTPGRLKNWARDIGPQVLLWVDKQLKSKAHPEQAYRVCLGLLNLSRQYPAQRLDAACRIANLASLIRLKQIKSILHSNRDRLPEQLELQADLPQNHENIRGPRNYH